MRSRRLQALLLAAAITMLVAACGTGTIGSSPAARTSPADSPPGTDSATPIRVRDFTLDPLAVTTSGGRVVLAVTNDGPTIHNVTIRDGAGQVIAATKDLEPGTSEPLSATLAPGTYVLFCSLPGHESLGIKGTLTVTP